MSQKRICTEKNCMETLTVRHIHQDRSWPVDTDGCARSGASNSIGIQHKKVCKKVAADVRGGLWGEMEGWSTNVSSTEMSTISRRNVRLKSWRTFLGITAAVSASLPSFGMVRAASASSHTKGGAWQLHSGKVCRKQWNLLWHYPSRWGGEKNITTVLEIEVCFLISQLPQSDKWPSFTFLSGQRGLVSIRRKLIFCDIAPTTVMKPLKGSSILSWDRLVGRMSIQFFWTYRYEAFRKAVFQVWKPLTAGAQPCILQHLIRNKSILIALFFFLKKHFVKVVQYQLAPRSGLCISAHSPIQSILPLVAHNRSSDRTQFMPAR